MGGRASSPIASASHMRIDLSREPDAKRDPTGENARARMVFRCSVSGGWTIELSFA